jgi:glycerol-3-phosphate cytidylyltransferase
LIAGLQTDASVDRPGIKNPPVQSIIERQIQLSACRFVDEIVVYTTEQDLIDLILTLPIDVRIMGEEYRDTEYTGKVICEKRKIEIYFNKRDHYFSSSDLRTRVFEAEAKKRGIDTWLKTNTTSASSVVQSSR